VQHSALPDIVPELNDPTHNSESNVPFDSTNAQFDNTVSVIEPIALVVNKTDTIYHPVSSHSLAHRATEYVTGTTVNPLVVNTNDTFNSDKRIFAHDGNATMNA